MLTPIEILQKELSAEENIIGKYDGKAILETHEKIIKLKRAIKALRKDNEKGGKIREIKELIKGMLVYERGGGRICEDCNFVIGKPQIYFGSLVALEIGEAICWKLGMRGWYERSAQQTQVDELFTEFNNSGQVTGNKEEDANRLAHLIYEDVYREYRKS